MGVDLTLCPEPHYTGGSGSFLAYDRIALARDRDLWDRLAETLPTETLPVGVTVEWYGDEGIEPLTEDPYGTRLTWARAASFAAIDPGETRHNRAVWAFLAALAPDRRVVLYWH